MITFHGIVSIPDAVIAAAEPIKMLNYKTTTPARFRKETLTPDLADGLMSEISSLMGVDRERLDYVYFSAVQGAEPHEDQLDPAVFTPHTYIIPVILPSGQNTITAEDDVADVVLGGIYEFNHEKTHSMTVGETESGCVVIMIAIKR